MARPKAATGKPRPFEAKPVDETAEDAPWYDDRGNVRPRGTKGAKPRTLAERKAIAKRLAGKSDG